LILVRFEFQHWQENIADACVSPDTLSHQAGGKQVIIEPTEADSAPSQTPAKPGIELYFILHATTEVSVNSTMLSAER